VKVTAGEEGAMFDMNKNGRLGITNICCFDQAHSEELFVVVKGMHNMIMPTVKLLAPELSQ